MEDTRTSGGMGKTGPPLCSLTMGYLHFHQHGLRAFCVLDAGEVPGMQG